MPNNPLYVEWGARLRTARKEAGLSQRQLADKAAPVDHTHISNIERGITSVSDELRIRLAGALGVTVQELFPYPDTAEAVVA